MHGKRLSIGLKTSLVIFALNLLATGTRAVTQQENVLYSFGSNSTDATYPYAGLVFDTAGNLYGTTYTGGTFASGTVFELMPKGGGWTEKVLHSFGNGKDGIAPYAGLIVDAAGNLYGTTENTIFELTPKAGGWAEKVLQNSGSTATLIFNAADSKLYGTTALGGSQNNGTLFELTRNADGAYPYAGLILGGSRHLYGTTYMGGAHNVGTVFEFTL